jgi:WD40 repeat protein
MGRRLALLVATYQYQDAGLHRLTAPAHDAEVFAAVLADPAIAGFEVTTLLNEPHHVVGQAIGDFYRDRRRDDLTLLYFTGHGLKDDDGHLYLAMADTAGDNLLFTALSADQVDRAMENCVSQQKVLVLDCCYSGAFPAGRIAKADTAVHSLERFSGRGRTVLTASDAIQYSFEGDPHGQAAQSVFTRHLVAGLRNGSADLDGDGDITLDELYTYVHDRVVEEMPQQRPKKQDNVEGRTIIARNVNWTLPGYLRNAIGSPIAADRLAALEGLAHLRRIGNEMVRSHVREEIRRLADDDSKQVSAAATALLEETDAVRDEPPTQREQQAATARQPAPPTPASPTPAPPAPAPPVPAPAVEPEPSRTIAEPAQDAPAPPRKITKPKSPTIAPKQPDRKPPSARTGQPTRRESKTSFLNVPPRPTWPRWVPKTAQTKPLIAATVLVVLLIGILVVVQSLTTKDTDTATSPDRTPEAFAVLTDFTDEVDSVQFSSNGHTLATTSGTEAELWDAATGRLTATIPGISELATMPGVDGVQISPDGKKLAITPDGTTPQLWDVATGKVTATFPSHAGLALMAFSPDGKILATTGTCACEADFDNPVRLWDTASGQLIRSLSGHVNGVQSMAFSPDGITLTAGAASGAESGPVRIWNVTTGATTATLTAGFILKFSPDSKILATSGEFTAEQKAQLWDVASGTAIATLAEGDPIAFSPDGKTLLTASPRTVDPGTTAAHLWQVPSGTAIPATLVSTPMVFAPDNKSLAIADTDSTVRLWEFASGTTTRTFTGHTGLVNDLAFSPDGKTLATASKDKTVRLWHTD